MVWEMVDGDMPKWAYGSWYWTRLHFPDAFSQVGAGGEGGGLWGWGQVRAAGGPVWWEGRLAGVLPSSPALRVPHFIPCLPQSTMRPSPADNGATSAG